MDKEELITIIEQEEKTCIGEESGELSEHRRKAMEYYYAKPYGNEVEGRSQVVTTEVFDAIEGMMPSLMSIFTGSDEIVRFDPNGPEDEPGARQATDYVNYLFFRVNGGFVALYCAVKDALMQKNGFLKVYWENYADNGRESYEGLLDDEFSMLMGDPELELIEHSESTQGGVKMHDAVFRRTRRYGRICVIPLPPEEVLISRDTTNDIKTARFVAHRCKKTISRLREEGYVVSDDLSDSESADFNQERIARLEYDDKNIRIGNESNDPATKEVWVTEAYLRVDFDGDGLAELRKVTKVGKDILQYKDENDKIYDANEEVDSIPIVTGTPIIMPHKLYGLSVAETIMDLQLAKSTVTRNLFDNFYYLNNGRWEILDGMVNMDDMLTSRPGGVVRSKVLGGVKRLDTPALGAPAYQLLEYLDNVKESRVGKRTFAPGPDASILKGTATGAEIYKTWDSERTLLIARALAETLIKDVYWKIFELVCKHQNKPQVIRLRNQWVRIDPRSWKNRYDMTVTVGLGTGTQQQMLSGAMGVMQIQGMLAQMGMMGQILTPDNLYYSAREYAKAVFPKQADSFFTDPRTLPPPQQQPDPDLLKIQLSAQKAQMSDRQRRDKMMMDYDIELRRMASEAGMSRNEFIGEMLRMAEQFRHDERMAGMNAEAKGAEKAQEAMERQKDRMQESREAMRGRMHELRTRPAAQE